jgi:hypothetical protein
VQGKNIPQARSWGPWSAVEKQNGGSEVAARVTELVVEVMAEV